MLRLIQVLMTVMVSGSVQAGLFGNETFDDCVLEGLKTAKTDLAVQMVVATCSSKHASETDNNNIIPPKNDKDENTPRIFFCETSGRPYRVEIDPEKAYFMIDDTKFSIIGETRSSTYLEGSTKNGFKVSVEWIKDYAMAGTNTETNKQFYLNCEASI